MDADRFARAVAAIDGANDADPTPGVFKVANAALGSYTVTETVAPAGYALDPAPRSVTVSSANLNATIDSQGQTARRVGHLAATLVEADRKAARG